MPSSPHGRPGRRSHRVSSIVACLLLAGLLSSAIALGEDPPTWPAISGDAIVGETLTATEAAVYKWQRCDGTTFSCAAGGGNNSNGWEDIDEAQGQAARTYALTEADVGLMIRVLAKQTAQGTQFSASEAVGPVAPADEPEPPEPPVFAKTANLDPVDGTVWVRPPGSNRPTRIDELTQVPLRSQVDVSAGRVELITQRRPSGRAQSIELWAGAFRLAQRRKGGITLLPLINAFGGPTDASTALRRKRSRKLWGRGKCRCRTKGKRSSGTARGTHWLTADRPDGTLTKVLEGKVLVKDLTRKRRVLVRAGERYLARSR